MLFFEDGKKINEKWDINNFVIGNGNKSRGKSGESKADFELSGCLRGIENNYKKNVSALDVLLREMKARRAEVRVRYKTMENDAENEALFQRLDIDLITSQVKLVESKNKMHNEKLKHMRDEKKLQFDLNKHSIVTSTVQEVVATGSPIGNVKPTQPSYYRAPQVIGTEAVNKIDEKYTETTTPPVTHIKGEAGPSGSHSGEVVDTVVSRNILGGVAKTVSGSEGARQEAILARLNDREKLYSNATNVLGTDYNISKNALVNNSKTIKSILVVDTESGKFFVREEEVTKHGDVPLTTSNPKSLLHIGKLKFNTNARTCTSEFLDDTMDYELTEGEDSFPAFYKEGWRKPESTRLILAQEVVDRL